MLHLTQTTVVIILFVTSPAYGQDPPEKEPYRSKDKDWVFCYRDPPFGDGIDSDLRLLNIAKLRFAQQTLEMQRIVFEVGSWDPGFNTMYPTVQNIVDTYIELGATKEERLMILSDCVKFIKCVEASAKKRYDVGSYRKQDLLMITYTRLDAEIQLHKAKEAK